MTKKQRKRILRIVFIIAGVTSLMFVPWVLVKAWILPLPDTIKEQVNEAIGHGFDGMIVYVTIEKIKYLPTRKPYSKLRVSANYL